MSGLKTNKYGRVTYFRLYEMSHITMGNMPLEKAEEILAQGWDTVIPDALKDMGVTKHSGNYYFVGDDDGK